MKYTFLFAGQGSQGIGMGKDFFQNSKLAKNIFLEASESLKIDFTKLLFEENNNLSETEYTQPAILLVGAIAHKLFSSTINIKASFALGHSLGEFSSLIVANSINIIDALKLVHFRGKLMSKACSGKNLGMMVSLGLEDDIVEKICKEQREKFLKVWPVNYNTIGQIVLAGNREDLKILAPILKKSGAKRAIILDMSVASHCPILNSAVEPLSNKIEELLKDNFDIPIISNVTAKAYQTKKEALELLPKQLIMPVRYKESILEIDDEVDCYIEFGHGAVLKGLNKKLSKKPHFTISDMNSLENTVKEIEKFETK